jgi:hypothetical protein
MSLAAALLAAAGLALLFAPSEVQRIATGSITEPLPPVLLQLWSAALLALAATNWTGRGMVLGGIYGRALVLGNSMHWTVGSLVMLRAALDRPASAGLWMAAVVYGLFAVAFARLLGRHPGPD